MIAATYASQVNQIVGGDAVCLRGEVRYEITRNQFDHATLELLQVAAVAVAALQQHGVRQR